jgi:hypothetical protein
MYAPTATGVADGRCRAQPAITAISPTVATASLTACAIPDIDGPMARHEQQVGPQQDAASGLRARMNALAIRPSRSCVTRSASRSLPARSALASSTS